MSRVLVVTGMHRSGTSLVANYLERCGLDMGEELLPADVGNPLGYYEDVHIHDLHRELLWKAGVADAFTVTDADVPVPVDEVFRERAREIVAKRADKPQWGWKEPRTALFLDLWADVLPDGPVPLRVPGAAGRARLAAPTRGERVGDGQTRARARDVADLQRARCSGSRGRIRTRVHGSRPSDSSSVLTPSLTSVRDRFGFDVSPVRVEDVFVDDAYHTKVRRRAKVLASRHKDELRACDALYDEFENPDVSSVSVALATYNGERFIDELFESLLAQQHTPSELVVCDDRSSDGTVAKVLAFAERAPFPVRLDVNERNLGPTKNFELAISRCEGEFIAMCDQDDVWYPDKLQRSVDALTRNEDVGYVFSDADMMDERGRPLDRRMWDAVGFWESRRQLARDGKLLQLLVVYTFVQGAATTFRSDLRELLLPIPHGWLHDAWIALLSAFVRPYLMIDEPLLRYRIHAEQEIGVPSSVMPDDTGLQKWKVRLPAGARRRSASGRPTCTGSVAGRSRCSTTRPRTASRSGRARTSRTTAARCNRSPRTRSGTSTTGPVTCAFAAPCPTRGSAASGRSPKSCARGGTVDTQRAC